MEKAIDKLERLLKGRQVYTTKELVKLGIFGSRKGVYSAIKHGKLASAKVSRQRLIIFKESLIEYFRLLNP